MLACRMLFESCERVGITDCTGGSSAINGVSVKKLEVCQMVVAETTGDSISRERDFRMVGASWSATAVPLSVGAAMAAEVLGVCEY